MNNYMSLRKPLKGFLRAEQVLDEDYISNEYIPCEVIGLCFYTYEVITFIIKLSDGEVFSYIPATAIIICKNIEQIDSNSNFSLKDLSFLNTPSQEVAVSYLTSLQGEVSVFFKEKKEWFGGEYICTIDFYNDNELLNLVLVEGGFLAFVPFHKMKFKKLGSIDKSFLPYKKQRNTYKI